MILSCQRALVCKNLKDEVQSAESFDSRNAGGQSGECAPRRLLFHTDLALLQCAQPARSNLWEILSFQPLWGAAAAAPPSPQRPAFSAIEAFMSLSRALPFLLE